MRRLVKPVLAIALAVGATVTADVAGQDAGCEAAREARLAPERARLIEQCVNQEKKERSFCDNYYRDYGYGGKSGGARVGRKYDNLPECVTAREAKPAATASSERTNAAKTAPKTAAKTPAKTAASDSGKKGSQRDADQGVNRSR